MIKLLQLTVFIFFVKIFIEILKGNFAIFYMLAKYVPGDIKYIFIDLFPQITKQIAIFFNQAVTF
jgi:hypothetical protein